MKRVAVALALAVVPACAWDDGEPFATVDGTLTAGWTLRADRGGAWQKLASDFELQVTGGVAELGELALVARGGDLGTFDPADPPAGYSLCHNGHCHADDGRLVAYEDIAAELGGGGGPSRALAVAVGERELVPGGATPLDCGESCDLDRAEVHRVELPIAQLTLSGRVRDTRATPRIAGELGWTLTLTRGAGAAPLSASVDLPIDRAHDPHIDLSVTFAPSAILLDGVHFERASGDGFAVEADAESRAAVEAALLELPLEVAITRRPF